jgi:hypothetical protein
VYITTGSAGQTATGPLNHPAMYYDAVSLGSCVLKINADTLRVQYLRQTGTIDDQFTLIKDMDCVIGTTCNDNDSCTINDVIDNYCYCHGEENHRYVTNTNNTRTGSLRDAVLHSCTGDTILFTSAVNDTIRLNTDIVINKSLVMLAAVGQNIIISGQLQTRMFDISATNQLTLGRITLHGGKEPTEGGAILNNGTMIPENCTFKNNWQGPTPRAWTNHGQVTVRIGTNYVRLY